MWPRVDRTLRERAFAELRRRQAHGEAHGLTPAQRLAQAEEIRASFAEPSVPGRVTPTDEPADLWLRVIAHLRECA